MSRTIVARTGIVAAALLSFAITTAPAAAEMTANEQELYEAALEEGTLTWYVSQFTTANAEAIATNFEQAYPGLSVDVIRTTGQVAYTRLRQDLRAGIAQCDVFSGTDYSHLAELKANGEIAQYTPENYAYMDEILKGFDPDGHFYTTSANPNIMIYNTNLVEEDEAPTNWDGLTDMKWENQIALAHPGFSGGAASWAVLMVKLYGDEFIEALLAPNPLVTRSLIDSAGSVSMGERKIALGTLAAASRLMGEGHPVAVIYPEDGAKVTPNGSAVLTNAPNPNGARLFLNYLLSEENSETLRTQGQQPVHMNVDPPEGVRALRDIAIAELTEEEVEEGSQRVIELWRDTFGN